MGYDETVSEESFNKIECYIMLCMLCYECYVMNVMYNLWEAKLEASK